MAQDKTIHTKPLGDNRYRDLSVYYDKGGMNYWDYSEKPKGIYFSSSVYSKSSSGTGFVTRTYSITPGKTGDGYLLISPLERYSRKQLSLVQERVIANADLIHAFVEQDNISNMKSLLDGSMSDVALRGFKHAHASTESLTAAA